MLMAPLLAMASVCGAADSVSVGNGLMVPMESRHPTEPDSLKNALEQEVTGRLRQQARAQRELLLIGGAMAIVFGWFSYRQRRRTREALKRSDELLLNILPAEVAEELKVNGASQARQFDQVTILFTDFKDFTAVSERLSPQDLVRELDTCFSAFDRIIDRYGIEKIKVIGDSYMCAGGVPDPTKGSAREVILAALEMQVFMEQRRLEREAAGQPAFTMRIGIHTGPVVAGIVGVKKFQYDIWGDTVNIASRMESSGEVGQVNISEATYELVRDAEPFSVVGSPVSGFRSATDNRPPTTIKAFAFTPRGKVQAKGKGGLEMYFVRLMPV